MVPMVATAEGKLSTWVNAESAKEQCGIGPTQTRGQICAAFKAVVLLALGLRGDIGQVNEHRRLGALGLKNGE